MCNNGSLKAKLILQIKNNLLPKKSENYPRTIFKALQLQKSPGDSHCLQMENMLYLWLNLPGSERNEVKVKLKKESKLALHVKNWNPLQKPEATILLWKRDCTKIHYERVPLTNTLLTKKNTKAQLTFDLKKNL